MNWYIYCIIYVIFTSIICVNLLTFFTVYEEWRIVS